MTITIEEIESVMGDDMTRINLVPVEELSDQHLIREYNELPRCLKQDINIKDAPDSYTLGTGHMKWARKNWCFLISRYKLLCREMDFRGFNRNFTWQDLSRLFQREYPDLAKNKILYTPNDWDIMESRNRIISKVKEKPSWYRWTNRSIPSYLARYVPKSQEFEKETTATASDSSKEVKSVSKTPKKERSSVKSGASTKVTKTTKTTKSSASAKVKKETKVANSAKSNAKGKQKVKK